jgi:hypothetical protein
MMTLGCSSTVIYNRGNGSPPTQTLSPLNYANLTITNNAALTATTVNLVGTARVNGILSFTGTAANAFNITAGGTLTFGLNATLSNSNSSTVDFGGQLVTLQTNSTLISGVNLNGVTNTTGVTTSNVVGTASSVSSIICKGRNVTITLASSTGTVQWQQSSDNSSWANISSATSSSYSSPNLSSTTYYRANVTNTTCSTGSSNVVTITINNNIYSLGSWSGNTPPIASDSIEFQGDYISSSDITACSCTVTSGNVIISSGNTLNLIDALYVNGGSMVFDDTASLIQTNSVASNTCYDLTKISFQRTTSPIRKFDYTYWSSPVSAQSLLNLSPNTSADKYFSFDSSINNWFNENPLTVMTLGKGYIVRGPQSYDSVIAAPFTGTFNGIPNNGNISININGTSGIFNLLGNPYPSALDSELLYDDNSGSIRPNFYFWTHYTPITANNYMSDDYAIYNAVLGAGIGTSQSAVSIGGAPGNFRYIASGQGFFVEGKGVGSVVFKNSHRVINLNNNFFKQENVNSNLQSNTLVSNKLWLNVTNSQGLFKQQLVCYLDDATNEYDELYDAKGIDVNGLINFFSLSSGDIRYSIQSRSPFTNEDIVLLGFSSTIAGTFTLSLDNFDGLFYGQDVYLVDNYLGAYTNLKEQSYEFVTNIGSFNDRFSIQYILPNLSVPANSFTNAVMVYSNNNELFIKSLLDNIIKIEIIDVLGRVILSEDHIDNTSKVMNANNNMGIVFAQITLASGVTIVKKVFL